MPRDSSGNYTLPAGNPVITGTTITSDWANNTMSDLGNEMTDSLSRSGQGGMLAPLPFVDGSQTEPGITFQLEPNLGWFRPSNAVIALAALGDIHMQYDATISRLQLTLGANPSVGLFPTAVGIPNYRIFDSAAFKRADYNFDEATGDVNLERYDDAAVIETRLTLTDDGNVSVNGAAPTQDADLTRKDYVDLSFDTKLAGYLLDGTHLQYVDDLNDITNNSVYLIRGSVVTNPPSDMGTDWGFIETLIFQGSPTDATQIIVGQSGESIDRQWQRTEAAGIWTPWILIVEGGSFTQRLLGYQANATQAEYADNLDIVLSNSMLYVVAANVTNEPTDFTDDGYLQTMVADGDTDQANQILYGGVSANSYKIWIRNRSAGVWNAWQLIISPVQSSFVAFARSTNAGVLSVDNGLLTVSDPGTGLLDWSWITPQVDTNYNVQVSCYNSTPRFPVVDNNITVNGFSTNVYNELGVLTSGSVQVLCTRTGTPFL